MACLQKGIFLQSEVFCSNLLQTESGWGIPCFSAWLYQVPDVPVVCVGYHCINDRQQLFTHVYLTFIQHRLSFSKQTSLFPSIFLLAVDIALASLIETACQELQRDPEACGDVPRSSLGWRDWKSSGVQGWRGCIGVAGACWEGVFSSRWPRMMGLEVPTALEHTTAGAEHGLQQQQVMFYCIIHQLWYLCYLLAMCSAEVVAGH